MELSNKDNEILMHLYQRRIADLNVQLTLLRREVDILRTRPEVTMIEENQYSDQNVIQGTRDRKRLVPGKKYKIHLKYELGESYHFETPMMLVETPEVRVETTELHTYQHDNIIPVKMERKK